MDIAIILLTKQQPQPQPQPHHQQKQQSLKYHIMLSAESSSQWWIWKQKIIILW